MRLFRFAFELFDELQHALRAFIALPPTPVARTVAIGQEDRVVTIAQEDRTVTIGIS